MCSSLIPALIAALAGCSTVGDFGRPKEYRFVTEATEKYERILNWVEDDKSRFVLSQDEMDIRRAAYQFHRPLPSALVPQKVVQLIKEERWGMLSNFADGQTHRGYADGTSRAGEIEELMGADQAWLERFSKAGKRVRAADRERLFVLEENNGAYSKDDRIHAHARIVENADILRAGLVDLDRRLLAYHYAIQRTRLEWPLTPLASTETRLSLLREKASRLRVQFGLDGTGVDFEEEIIIEPVKVDRRQGRYPVKMRMPSVPLDRDGAARTPRVAEPGAKSRL